MVNNSEIFTLKNKIYSDEPPSNKPTCSRSIEEHMTELRKKKYENYLQYKGSSTRTDDKDTSLYQLK